MSNLEAVSTLELKLDLAAYRTFTRTKGQHAPTPTRLFTLKRKIREMERELETRADEMEAM